MNNNVEVRSQKPGAVRLQQLGTVVLSVVVGLVAGTPLRAQTVNLGGTGALGAFSNPTSVVTNAGTETCGISVIQIDLAQGKVFAIPDRKAGNALCTDRSPVDITSTAFPGLTGPINNGVLEVTTFTLQASFGPSTFIDNDAGIGNITSVVFVPNANNTPVWLRATGNITINSTSGISVRGASGQANPTTFLRGTGGNGGPGGYRGGDGGNGGLSPSEGSAGFGSGGGNGGLPGTGSSCNQPTTGAKFLTTGKTVGGTVIPASNDLLTIMRGGSGGGGGGGCTNAAGDGGGGGGGAILIASNGTITVNGTLSAQGGDNSGCTSGSGAGGVLRLVAATIAGGGAMDVREGNRCAGPASDAGIMRLEAFNITYTGSTNGNVAAASSPGQIILPGTATASAFLQISKVTNSANASETVSPSLAAQDVAGRTGKVNPVDVTMPDVDATPVSTVTVDFLAGPNTVSVPFPAGKVVTLVVTPLDPAQGAAANYTGTLVCPSPGGGNCTASISGVALPLGFSSFSAFTVVSIDTGGALARMFPKTYEGEAIEAVRLETGDKGMEYVLIAASGREFPYRPQ